MILWVIVGVALAILGGLAYLISQMPETVQKKKKEKRLPPPEPPKDWQAIAQRLEKRVVSLDRSLDEAQGVIRQKEKEIADRKAAESSLQRQYEQEQLWRKKEEETVAKDKKREHVLEDELAHTRDGLNKESTERIRLEYEVKDLRHTKEQLSAEARRASAQNLELERRVKSLVDENRELKAQNFELKKKKEADQWVAKDDFVRIEKSLKRARWEVELFKSKFAEDLWPRELIPKQRGPAPMLAGAEPTPAQPSSPPPAPAEVKTATQAPSPPASEPPAPSSPVAEKPVEPSDDDWQSKIGRVPES